MTKQRTSNSAALELVAHNGCPLKITFQYCLVTGESCQYTDRTGCELYRDYVVRRGREINGTYQDGKR